MERKEYDVFISYSRKDYVDENKTIIPNNVVSIIRAALEKHHISYWFDDEGVYSGQNFTEIIVTNIEASKIFLFLSTENSNKSRWTCKEIASADEFGKHIIPVRIDQTPYNKKVLFRIADLDFIEYYSNPEKGLNDMIESIKKYLEQLAEEEKRRKEEIAKKQEEERLKTEEEKRRKEQEERRRQEEQSKIVANLRLSCTKLNNEETKLEIDRANLLISAEKVLDAEERDALKQFIVNSSPVFNKYRKEYQALLDQIANLKKSLSGKEDGSSDLKNDIQTKNNLIAELHEKLNHAKQQIEELKAENNSKRPNLLPFVSKHWFVSGLLLFSVIVLVLSFIPQLSIFTSSISLWGSFTIFLFLVIGLFRPANLSMGSRKEVLLSLLPALFALLVAFVIACWNDEYVNHAWDTAATEEEGVTAIDDDESMNYAWDADTTTEEEIVTTIDDEQLINNEVNRTRDSTIQQIEDARERVKDAL